MRGNILTIKRLRGSTIFKICTIGCVFGMLAISIVIGICAAFGLASVELDGQAVTGFKAILIAPLAGITAGAVIGMLLSAVIYIGLRIWCLIKPFTIEFHPVEK